jgi:hypothetical protein
MTPSYPYVDSPVKQQIIDACEQGRQTNDWNPLLKVMSQALTDGTLDGPFFFHARMVIDNRDLYNWCILEMDNQNVRWMQDYLSSVGGFGVVQDRYEKFFHERPPFPIHFPARLLAANEDGNAGDPSTVAWFLHEHLPGIRKESLEFVCGIEMVSSWKARFEEVYYPGGQATLDPESLSKLRALENEIPFGAATTIYATIHDAGHWLGYMRCLSQTLPFTHHMTSQLYASMGELVTDMVAIGLMIDLFPSVTATILNMRLFDFCYRNTAANPLEEALNHQFDTIANATLLMHFLKTGVLTQNGDRWHLDFEKLPIAALALATDLESLGKQMHEMEQRGETARIEAMAVAWYKQYLIQSETGRWVYPEAIQPFLAKLESSTDLRLDMKRMVKHYPLQAALPVPVP